MSDPRAAAELAYWLLKRHWRLSSLTLLACLPMAWPASKLDSVSWGLSVVVLVTASLSAGVIDWQSGGWAQWVRRLPMHPRWVWGAQWLWLAVLALPALFTYLCLTIDGPVWAAASRSLAWLVCLASVLLAPSSSAVRLGALICLTTWLYRIGIALESAPAAAVVHDLALAAGTFCYVLFGVRPVQQVGISIWPFVVPALLFIQDPELSTVILISCLGIAFLGLLAFDRARSGNLQDLLDLASTVVFFGAIVAGLGYMFWKLIRALFGWSDGPTFAERLDKTQAFAADALAVPITLLSALVIGWLVVLLIGEHRRQLAVDAWLRQRGLLDRMPLTRWQVNARVLWPQLRIVAKHSLLFLVLGGAAAWGFRALELEGANLGILRGGATTLGVALTYLLVAQVFVFHRGAKPWYRSVALVSAMIILPLTLIWPMILAISVSTIAVTALGMAAYWMMRQATGRRSPLGS